MIGMSDRMSSLRKFWSSILLTFLMVLGGSLSTTPAWADAPGETTKGYLLVQQALGHLAHDTTKEGFMLAMEKVDDALETKDQAGVDVAQLQQARAALEAGQLAESRTLLQNSITVAVSQLKVATGLESGTTIVLLPLERRGSLNGQDWGFLLASLLVLGLGLVLSWRFRPEENIRELRQNIDSSTRKQAVAQSQSLGKDAL